MTAVPGWTLRPLKALRTDELQRRVATLRGIHVNVTLHVNRDVTHQPLDESDSLRTGDCFYQQVVVIRDEAPDFNLGADLLFGAKMAGCR